MLASYSLLATEQGRQYLVTFALHMTNGTRLEASAYERRLLEQFVQGDVTIAQVVAALEMQQTV